MPAQFNKRFFAYIIDILIVLDIDKYSSFFNNNINIKLIILVAIPYIISALNSIVFILNDSSVIDFTFIFINFLPTVCPLLYT